MENPAPGTMQSDRCPEIGSPEAPLLEELQVEEFLNFVQDFSRILRFWGPQGTSVGDWSPFFTSSLIFALADIGRTSLDAYEGRLTGLVREYEVEPLNAQRGRILAGLLAVDLELAEILLGWYRRIGDPAKAGAEPQVSVLVRETLGANLDDAPVAFYRAYEQLLQSAESSPDSVVGIDLADRTHRLAEDYAGVLREIHSGAGGPVVTAASGTVPAGNDGLRTWLVDLGRKLLKTLGCLRSSVPGLLASCLRHPNQPPHVALLLGFFAMLGKTVGQLNGTSARHLDFYYRSVLGLRPAEAVPDRVWLTFGIGPGLDEVFLPKGTRFPAGTGPGGAKILYRTEREIAVNRALAVAFKRVVNTTLDADPGRASAGALLSAPVANSADGLGAPLTGEPASWPPFSVPGTGSVGAGVDPAQLARVGFAVSSPALLLSEGRRTVRLRLMLDADGVRSLLADLKQSSVGPVDPAPPSVIPAVPADEVARLSVADRYRFLRGRVQALAETAERLAGAQVLDVVPWLLALGELERVGGLVRQLTVPTDPKGPGIGADSDESEAPLVLDAWSGLEDEFGSLPGAVETALERRSRLQVALRGAIKADEFGDWLTAIVAGAQDYRTTSTRVRARLLSLLGPASAGVTRLPTDPNGAIDGASDPDFAAYRAAVAGLGKLLGRDPKTVAWVPRLADFQAGKGTSAADGPLLVSTIRYSLDQLETRLRALEAEWTQAPPSASPAGDSEGEGSAVLADASRQVARLAGELDDTEKRLLELADLPLLVRRLGEPAGLVKVLLGELGSVGTATVAAPAAPVASTGGNDPATSQVVPASPSPGPPPSPVDSFVARFADLTASLHRVWFGLLLTQGARSLLDQDFADLATALQQASARAQDAWKQADAALTSAFSDQVSRALKTAFDQASQAGRAPVAGVKAWVDEVVGNESGLAARARDFVAELDWVLRWTPRHIARVEREIREAAAAMEGLLEQVGRLAVLARSLAGQLPVPGSTSAGAGEPGPGSTSGGAGAPGPGTGGGAGGGAGAPGEAGSTEVVARLKSLEARLAALPEEPLWERIGELFAAGFRSDYTAPDGWSGPLAIAASAIAVLPPASNPGQVPAEFGVEISGTLEPTLPAWAGYVAKVHGAGYGTVDPLWRFVLDQQAGWPFSGGAEADRGRLFNAYPWFSRIRLEQVALAAEVQGGRSFTARNSFSPLDPKAPFQPFGAVPVMGTELVLGNVEVLRQRLACLTLFLEWFDLPDLPGGFADYYQDYTRAFPDRPFGNEVFKGRFEWIRNRVWGAPAVWGEFSSALSGSGSGGGTRPPAVELFSWAPRVPGSGTSMATVNPHEGSWSPGPLKPVSRFFMARFPGAEDAGGPAAIGFRPDVPFDDQAANGFLRLTLSDPAYAFGQAEYPAVAAVNAGLSIATTVPADGGSTSPPATSPAGSGVAIVPLSEFDPGPDNGTLLDRVVAVILSIDSTAGLAGDVRKRLSDDTWDFLRRFEPDLTPPAPPPPPPPPAGSASVPAADPAKPVVRIPPPRPYVPRIKTIRFDSVIAEESSGSGAPGGHGPRFFALHPFGISRPLIPGPSLRDAATPEVTIVPGHRGEGTLYVGLQGVQAPRAVSVLFIVKEGSGGRDGPPPPVTWSFLRSDRWVDFPAAQVRDETESLTVSGLVRFDLTEGADTDSMLFLGSVGLCWLRAVVERHGDRVCEIVAVATQAVTASYESGADPQTHFRQPLPAGTITSPLLPVAGLAGVQQPAASFGGRAPENLGEFRARVRERLRHKGRAVTPWDYEHLMLQEFPGLWVARCLPATRGSRGASPGQVTVVVVPDRRGANVDPLTPAAGRVALRSATEFLSRLTDPSVSVEVANPEYLFLEVRAVIELQPEDDPGHYLTVLGESLVGEIAPWHGGDMRINPFVPRLTFEGLRGFIRRQPYVRSVPRLALRLRPAGDPEGGTWLLDNSDWIQPPHPGAVITSAPRHVLLPSTTDPDELAQWFPPEPAGSDPAGAGPGSSSPERSAEVTPPVTRVAVATPADAWFIAGDDPVPDVLGDPGNFPATETNPEP